MARKPRSGEGAGKAPPQTPVPIVVPRGDKHSREGAVKRWIREFTPSEGPEPEKKPKREPEEKSGKETGGQPEEKKTGISEKPRSFHGPVQRATIQLLPGRLEPVDPKVIQQEIRFLRGPSREQAVTLGWNLGEPPEHVTLNHSSVAPEHARMTYREGGWWIESLSRHDPVAVNRRPVPFGGEPLSLADGDEIRIGAVLFTFRFP